MTSIARWEAPEQGHAHLTSALAAGIACTCQLSDSRPQHCTRLTEVTCFAGEPSGNGRRRRRCLLFQSRRRLQRHTRRPGWPRPTRRCRLQPAAHRPRQSRLPLQQAAALRRCSRCHSSAWMAMCWTTAYGWVLPQELRGVHVHMHVHWLQCAAAARPQRGSAGGRDRLLNDC